MGWIESPLDAILTFGDPFELIDSFVEVASSCGPQLRLVVEQLYQHTKIINFSQALSDIAIDRKNGEAILFQA